jgi:hypothetical protein
VDRAGRGGNGGSGIVILTWDSALPDPIVGAGITSSLSTTGSTRVLQCTAGSGTITF